MQRNCTAFLFFFLSLPAFGQVDASSEILLGNVASAPGSSGIESGRYKVKAPEKKPEKKPKSGALPAKKVGTNSNNSDEQLNQATSVVVTPTTTLDAKPSTVAETSETKAPVNPEAKPPPATSTKVDAKKKPTLSPAPSEMEKILFSKSATEKPVEKTAETAPTPEIEEPTVTEQVKDLVLGNQQPAVEAYKEQIHPDDIRMNRIEINIKPGVLSNTSKSSYSYRDYSSFSPKILLGAQFWLTPFLGIYGDYTTTMGADVAGEGSTRSRIMAQDEWTELGLDVRKFFGMSRKSNSIQFGIHLSEYKFSVPGDEIYRLKLKSSGFGLHLLNRIPVAPSYSWIVGGKLMPRIQHAEIETGLTASSGSTGESSRIELMVGGEFKMSRQNQIVWDVTAAFEKNQFGGQASAIDPETGSKPKGVSVENTFILISFGYRWGQ
jgi:hypothetical protein